MSAATLLAVLVLLPQAAAQTRPPEPRDATAAILSAFETHNLVLFGEAHGCKQEYQWLRELIGAPGFSRVDDIVVELGNALYQPFVDRYTSGADVPYDQVQHAWRDAIGMLNAPSPVLESLYAAVRDANRRRPAGHPLRIVLGGPAADWATITTRDQLKPYLEKRDAWYARRVQEEVLDKGHRALLVMGGLHFERVRGPGPVERQLRAAGASTYLVLFSPAVYDDPDKRYADWHAPSIIGLAGNWVGALRVMEGMPGGSSTLADLADAVVFLAPRFEHLTVLSMPRDELEGTPYGKELERRMQILRGRPLEIPAAPEQPLRRQ